MVLLAFVWVSSPLYAGPNHLEPIEPYSRFGDGYNKLVLDILVGSRQVDCWAVSRPSFRPELALMLDRELIDSKPNSPTQKPKFRWYLETAVSAVEIWRWKDEIKGKPKSDLLKEAKVKRKRIEVTEELGETVAKSWDAALRLTRYPEQPTYGSDGTTYDFYSRGFYGTTWSPSSGIPADLVALTDQLQSLVNSGSETQPTIEKEALEAARKLLDNAQREHEKISAIERTLNAGHLQIPPSPPSSR